MKKLIIVFFFIFFLLELFSQNSEENSKRLALVIGNGAYPGLGALKNPTNDARAMKETLEKLGFDVMLFENLSQSQMSQRIDEFGMKTHEYDVALFYYAGHGIQTKGLNYLVPVDATLQTENQIEYQCVRADRMFGSIEGDKLNIIILDACRNNPFERSWGRATSGSGLAFMQAPSNSFIAYATAPGQTANDGTGKNGLYTEVLIEELLTPNKSINEIFQSVRQRVENKSKTELNALQTPWESTSLNSNFYFLIQDVPGETGTIALTTKINGKLYIDNVFHRDIIADSSYTFKDLQPGIREIKIDGDKVWTERIKVIPGQTSKLYAAFEMLPKIKINSNPSGQKVMLNNAYIGVTPLETEMNYGAQKVLIEGSGIYESTEQNIEIKKGGQTEFMIILKQIGVNASINSNPGGAEVKINDKTIGNTPVTAPLLYGKYQLALYKEGFRDVSESVVVEKNTTEFYYTLMSNDKALNELKFKQYTKKRNTFLYAMGGSLLLGATFSGLGQSFYGKYKDADNTEEAVKLHRTTLTFDILRDAMFTLTVGMTVPIWIYNAKRKSYKTIY